MLHHTRHIFSRGKVNLTLVSLEHCSCLHAAVPLMPLSIFAAYTAVVTHDAF